MDLGIAKRQTKINDLLVMLYLFFQRCDNNLLSNIEPKCNTEDTVSKNCVQMLQFASQGNALHSFLSYE